MLLYVGERVLLHVTQWDLVVRSTKKWFFSYLFTMSFLHLKILKKQIWRLQKICRVTVNFYVHCRVGLRYLYLAYLKVCLVVVCTCFMKQTTGKTSTQRILHIKHTSFAIPCSLLDAKALFTQSFTLNSSSKNLV